MRARHRHFNPRDAGADLVLDSRFINQANSTAVSTWPDRSGNGHDATQSTGANQPTFLTAQQGGNGGVSFDGSNDTLLGTYSPEGVPRSCHAVFKSNVTDVRNIFQVPRVPSTYGWIARWAASGTTFISGDVAATNQTLNISESNATNVIIGSWNNDSSRNVAFWRDGATRTVTGNPPNAIASPTTAGFRIGSLAISTGSAFQFWQGLIYAVHVWTGEQIPAPIRKRCEHATAFAFKIACN